MKISTKGRYAMRLMLDLACLDEGDDVNCEKREECVTLILWKKINDAICSVVDHITLQDLVDWQREKNGDYVI